MILFLKIPKNYGWYLNHQEIMVDSLMSPPANRCSAQFCCSQLTSEWEFQVITLLVSSSIEWNALGKVSQLFPRLPLFHLLSEQDCFPEWAQQQWWRSSGYLGWPICYSTDATKMTQLTSLFSTSTENAHSVSKLLQCFASLLVLRDTETCTTIWKWNVALTDWYQGLVYVKCLSPLVTF